MSHDVSVSVRHHMVMRRSFSLCFIGRYVRCRYSAVITENRKSYPSVYSRLASGRLSRLSDSVSLRTHQFITPVYAASRETRVSIHPSTLRTPRVNHW